MASAAEIMTPGAQCVGEHQTLVEAAKMMRDLDIGALPVCGDDNRLHGIITDRDIVLQCVAKGLDPSAATAAELAQGKPYVVFDDADVADVLHVMEQHQIRRMPVVSHEDKALVGMITEADLARHLSPTLLAEFVESITEN